MDSKLPNYKSDEAFAFEVAAFAIVAVVGWILGALTSGALVGLLVGTIVWLYFRHEKRKETEQQIREFMDWQQRFEESKKAFLNSI